MNRQDKTLSRPNAPVSRQPVCRAGSHCGFSLIELLIVVSIVAVLISIVLPALSQARYKARDVQCQANLKQLVFSSLAYANDNKSHAPYAAYETYGRGCFNGNTRKILFDNYGLGHTRLWWCPHAYFRTVHNSSFRLGQNPRWFNDPTWEPSGLEWTENHRNQQGYNYYMGPGRGSGVPASQNMPVAKRFSDVRSPSTRIVWNDNIKSPGATAGGVSGTWQHPCNTHDRGNGAIPEGAYHAMADGHVEFRQYYWGVNTNNWVYQYFIFQ